MELSLFIYDYKQNSPEKGSSWELDMTLYMEYHMAHSPETVANKIK